MTVSYQYDVASSTSGGFTRLLLKWRGSLYKIIYKELSVFTLLYIAISLMYRLYLTEDQKRTFEGISLYCDTLMGQIPLSFILGFYVSFVASRWWQQYIAIPWPDKMVHAIALHVSGVDEQGRILRRTLVRYLNLSLVLVLRSISSAVKKRFPTLEHLVDAGFITKAELELYSTVPNTEFNTYWVPCSWFTSLLKEARASKRIQDPIGVKLIMEEFSEFRQKCGLLWSYDWVSIPLVYTQVVTIATYAFFMASLIGRQFVEKSPLPHKNNVDLFVPFFTMLQYFFYMGLLKVAEQLINPFGDDDEDFELNWIIDRHMKVSYLIVDTLVLRTPTMEKDIFFDDESPQLPYTGASVLFKKRTYRGSVADMIVPEKEQNMILPEIQEEDIPVLLKDGKHLYYDYESGPSPSPHTPRRGSGSSAAKILTKRRSATSGSKGIGNALLSVGHHQGFLATYPEKMTEAAEQNDKEADDLEFFVLPVKDYHLDIDSICYEDETGKRPKSGTGTPKIPPSIKAKVAVKKKPVIKWKPYQRPERMDEMPYATTDDSTPPPGMFEEETAFMWRTIDIDDSESVRTVASGFSYDTKDFVHPDAPSFSQYNEIKPHSIMGHQNASSIDELLNENHRLRNRSKRNRRSWGRPSYTSNKLHNSWPQIHRPKCSHRQISSALLKSVSDASIFLDCLSTQLRLLQMKKYRRKSSSLKKSTSNKTDRSTKDSLDIPLNSNVS